MKHKLLLILFNLTLLVSSVGVLTACTSPATYPVTIEGVTGGIAKVTLNEVNSQAKAGSSVMVTIAIPNQRSDDQVNHQFKSITITGANGTTIKTTKVVEGQSYKFKMPAQAVSISVSLELSPLAVYLQYGSSGAPVLEKMYSQSEMEAMSVTQPQYYTGLDEVGPVQGKGHGVLLSAIINDVKKYDPNINFSSGASLTLKAADGYFYNYTYDYLLGTQRYYYPHLSQTSNSIADSVAIEPMFMIDSYQDRSLSRAQLDTMTLDTTYSYRFCFGLLPSDVNNETVTVNQFVFWVDQIIITMPTPTQS